MNVPDPEALLRRLSPRPLPPEWKRDILASARAPQGLTLVRRIERVLWAAIPAAWVVIMALQMTTPVIPRPAGPAIDPVAAAEYFNRVRHFAATGEFPPMRVQLGETFILKPRS